MRRALTLVEVLVAIAVIATLLALSIAPLAHLRAAGRRTQCLSNCRTCATSIGLYTNDYAESFPNFARPKLGPAFFNAGIGCPYFVQSVHWPLALQGYLNAQPTQVEAVQLCPGNRLLADSGYEELMEAYTRGYVFPSDYHLALGVFSDPRMWHDDGDVFDSSLYRAVRAGEVQVPDRKGMLLETIPRHIAQPAPGQLPTNWIHGAEAHRHAFTTAFMDGRAESVAFADFLTPSRPKNLEYPAPVLSTPQGILGRDVR